MYRLKSVFAVLVTAGIVVACAMLPALVAAMQDKAQQDEITYGDVNAVKLEVEQLNMFEKLFLFGNGQSIVYNENKAKLSEDEIETLVYEQIAPYIDAGLIPCNIDELSIGATPVLFFYSGKEDLSSVFWNVGVYSSGKEFHYLDLFLDDETGKMIIINLYCDDPIYENSMYELIQVFYEIYCANMADELDFIPVVEMVEYNNTDIKVISAEIRWGDMIYGELTLEFAFSPNSFYNRVY